MQIFNIGRGAWALAMTLAMTLAVTMALASPALAQAQPAPAPQTPKQADTTGTAAPTGDGVAGGLDMGQVVDGTRQVGQAYVDGVFGDWERKCVKAETGKDPCQLYQLIKDKDGTPTAEISIMKLPAGGQAVAGATIVVPLQTLLTAQATLAVDGGQTKRYPFRFCTQIGCFAQVGLTKEDLQAFKRGAKATLTIVPAGSPQQKVNLTISLKGFTAGYDSL